MVEYARWNNGTMTEVLKMWAQVNAEQKFALVPTCWPWPDGWTKYEFPQLTEQVQSDAASWLGRWTKVCGRYKGIDVEQMTISAIDPGASGNSVEFPLITQVGPCVVVADASHPLSSKAGKKTIRGNRSETGEQQTPIPNSTVAYDARPSDTYSMPVIFVLDVSGSMEGAPLAELKTVMLQVIANMPMDVNAAIIAFSDTASVQQAFTTEKSLLCSAIGALGAGGGTDYTDALEDIVSLVAASCWGHVRVVFVSDGAPNASPSDLLLGQVRDANIVVDTVAIGSGGATELQRLATVTSGTFYSGLTGVGETAAAVGESIAALRVAVPLVCLPEYDSDELTPTFVMPVQPEGMVLWNRVSSRQGLHDPRRFISSVDKHFELVGSHYIDFPAIAWEGAPAAVENHANIGSGCGEAEFSCLFGGIPWGGYMRTRTERFDSDGVVLKTLRSQILTL
jgi:uncharacterized protein YegL